MDWSVEQTRVTVESGVMSAEGHLARAKVGLTRKFSD